MSTVMRALVSGLVVAVLAGMPVLAHDGKDEHPEPGAIVEQPAAPALPEDALTKVKIADVDLLDRNGNSINFRKDALGEGIVAIDFVYTTCTTACPVLSAIFAEVQDILGERLDREVRMVSISLDPVRDTPSRMRDNAAIFGAGPGWLWLTGDKPAVDRLLTGLGAYTPDIESHPPMILVGDPVNDRWTRLFGFVSPDEIMARIDALAAARGSTASQQY